MNDQNRMQSSGEWREALVEYLYGELPATRTEELERRLATDPALRAEWEALRATRAELDAWEAPVAAGPLSDDEARALAQAAAGGAAGGTDSAEVGRPPLAPLAARPARSAIRRPWLAAVAAGLIAFLGLGALGTQVARDGDRLTASFRLPWADPVEMPPQEEWAGLTELHAGLAAVREEQVEELAAWSRGERAQRLELARALDNALLEHRLALGRLIDSLGRETAREDLRTRAALADLASFIDQSNKH